MKILHVTHSADPASGGPIEGIKQLGLAHQRLGHQVEVACLDTPEAAWVAAFPLTLHALGPGRGKFGYSAKLPAWLDGHAQRFQVVVIHGLWQFHGAATAKAMRRLGRPYLVFTHGMLDPWFKRTYRLKHLKKWAYWLWAEYATLRDAAAVLFTTEEERLRSRESFWLYSAREKVVGFGAVAPPADRERQRQAFTARFPQLAATRNLLFLGRIHAKKGCDLLVRAFAEVAGKDPALRLVFAGPDHDGWRSELERLAGTAAGRIVWTGMLAGDEKWGAFRGAEAFVLPSHQENFGVAVAEALACGVPVLISDKVNIWREVAAANAGLTANDDLDGTLSLLQRWCLLPIVTRTAMATAGERLFNECFEIGRVAQGLLGVFKETAGSASALPAPVSA